MSGEIERIRKTLPWLRFLGWFYAVVGGVGSLALVGIPWLVMGIFLILAARAGDRLLGGGPSESLGEYHGRLYQYFLTLGITTIIGVVVGLVVACFYALMALVFGVAVVYNVFQSQ